MPSVYDTAPIPPHPEIFAPIMLGPVEADRREVTDTTGKKIDAVIYDISCFVGYTGEYKTSDKPVLKVDFVADDGTILYSTTVEGYGNKTVSASDEILKGHLGQNVCF